MNQTADNYLLEGCGRCPLAATPGCKVHRWTGELKLLRAMVHSCGLTETCKWGVPCYTFQHKNILLISALKAYCCISFFKGALLKDAKNLLEKPGAHSQADRLLRFTHTEAIHDMEDDIKAFIAEAVEIEKAGLKVPYRKHPETVPEEWEANLSVAFEALTPGRQRGYILYFSQPKQAKTRISRMEKWIPKILSGEGLHDKYQSKNK